MSLVRLTLCVFLVLFCEVGLLTSLIFRGAGTEAQRNDLSKVSQPLCARVFLGNLTPCFPRPRVIVPSFFPYRVNTVKWTLANGLIGGSGNIYIVFIWFQVKNFSDVHPDYGARIQALLDKYNAEKPKVSPAPPGCGGGRVSWIR